MATLSEEEYSRMSSDYQNPHYQQHSFLSKAELRKCNKPIMERKRRARINSCLNELKQLILEAMKKDPSRYPKLEKADILEMTVKHLQAVQREQLGGAAKADPSVLARFQSGFAECATEVSRYVVGLEGVDRGVRQRLIAHLSGCVAGLRQIAPLAAAASAANNSSIAEDVNNNGRTPATHNRNESSTDLFVHRRSAFTAVRPRTPEQNEHRRALQTVRRIDSDVEEPELFLSSIDPVDFSRKRPASDHIIQVPAKRFNDTPPNSPEEDKGTSSSNEQSDMWRPW